MRRSFEEDFRQAVVFEPIWRFALVGARFTYNVDG
jgi:hypothetical protein